MEVDKISMGWFVYNEIYLSFKLKWHNAHKTPQS